MKKFFFVFAVILIGLSVHTTSAAQNDMMCTMEYAPVCGSVQVQCITAPCNPVRQTFGNACVARAAQATNVTTGECADQSVPPIVGGDSDIHGCKASAGYSWESRLNSCVRSWETRTMVMNIANTLAPCVGVAPMQCLQIQRGSKKELFYDTIAGFDYMPGYTYRVLVRRDRVENPPADVSAYTYSLVKILSKKPSLADTKWRLTGYNATPVTDMATLEFARNSLHAKFCNNMNAQYRLQGDKIIAPLMMRTEMYCMSPLMTMEDHFDFSQAKYSFSGASLILTTHLGTKYTFIHQ